MIEVEAEWKKEYSKKMHFKGEPSELNESMASSPRSDRLASKRST